MALLDSFKTTAGVLLKAYGEALTFTRVTTGTFDPATGASTGDTTTTYISNCLFSSYNANEVDGSVILSGDAKVLFDPNATQPLIGDTVLKDSIVWRVVAVGFSQANGGTALYTLQVRR